MSEENLVLKQILKGYRRFNKRANIEKYRRSFVSEIDPVTKKIIARYVKYPLIIHPPAHLTDIQDKINFCDQVVDYLRNAKITNEKTFSTHVLAIKGNWEEENDIKEEKENKKHVKFVRSEQVDIGDVVLAGYAALNVKGIANPKLRHPCKTFTPQHMPIEPVDETITTGKDKVADVANNPTNNLSDIEPNKSIRPTEPTNTFQQQDEPLTEIQDLTQAVTLCETTMNILSSLRHHSNSSSEINEKNPTSVTNNSETSNLKSKKRKALDEFYARNAAQLPEENSYIRNNKPHYERINPMVDEYNNRNYILDMPPLKRLAVSVPMENMRKKFAWIIAEEMELFRGFQLNIKICKSVNTITELKEIKNSLKFNHNCTITHEIKELKKSFSNAISNLLGQNQNYTKAAICFHEAFELCKRIMCDDKTNAGTHEENLELIAQYLEYTITLGCSKKRFDLSKKQNTDPIENMLLQEFSYLDPCLYDCEATNRLKLNDEMSIDHHYKNLRRPHNQPTREEIKYITSLFPDEHNNIEHYNCQEEGREKNIHGLKELRNEQNKTMIAPGNPLDLYIKINARILTKLTSEEVKSYVNQFIQWVRSQDSASYTIAASKSSYGMFTKPSKPENEAISASATSKQMDFS